MERHADARHRCSHFVTERGYGFGLRLIELPQLRHIHQEYRPARGHARDGGHAKNLGDERGRRPRWRVRHGNLDRAMQVVADQLGAESRRLVDAFAHDPGQVAGYFKRGGESDGPWILEAHPEFLIDDIDRIRQRLEDRAAEPTRLDRAVIGLGDVGAQLAGHFVEGGRDLSQFLTAFQRLDVVEFPHADLLDRIAQTAQRFEDPPGEPHRRVSIDGGQESGDGERRPPEAATAFDRSVPSLEQLCFVDLHDRLSVLADIQRATRQGLPKLFVAHPIVGPEREEPSVVVEIVLDQHFHPPEALHFRGLAALAADHR